MGTHWGTKGRESALGSINYINQPFPTEKKFQFVGSLAIDASSFKASVRLSFLTRLLSARRSRRTARLTLGKLVLAPPRLGLDPQAMASSIQPNQTLYINNLNDKVNKEELRSQLYSLFMTYGRVIDVVAKKGNKMKGQAFLAFSDLTEATAAMRACEGMIFYDKPLVRFLIQELE